MKIAVVHDWLVSNAGSERVLEQIIELYPEADLHAVIDFLPVQEKHTIQNKKVRTSFIQRLPFAKKKYRAYLPLMPLAVERLDLSGYELILSSSHAVAKGIKKNSRQIHVCYCHTPMRYAWDLREQYLKESGLDKGFKGALAKMLLDRLQKWDYKTAQSVDYFVANSHYIADRIKRAYGRGSLVIYPPVDVKQFTIGPKKEDYYVTASRMVPYKKIDLIVDAFSQIPDERLVVIGDGPDYAKVKAKAGRNIELLGHQPHASLCEHLQRAKAFVFAAEEDFGILPVEAQACGTPVIAYGKGGSLETVSPLRNAEFGMRNEKRPAPTGVFFYEQTTEALKNAVILFERNQDAFDTKRIRENALRFGKERFKKEFKEFVEKVVREQFTECLSSRI